MDIEGQKPCLHDLHGHALDLAADAYARLADHLSNLIAERLTPTLKRTVRRAVRQAFRGARPTALKKLAVEAGPAAEIAILTASKATGREPHYWLGTRRRGGDASEARAIMAAILFRAGIGASAAAQLMRVSPTAASIAARRGEKKYGKLVHDVAERILADIRVVK